MKHTFFFLAFFIQLATGFPLTPLFFFWQILYAEFAEILFWSLLVFASLAMTSGSIIIWFGAVTGIAAAGFFARKHLFSRFSPFIITGFLFFYTVILWLLFNGQHIFTYKKDIVKMTFIYFLLFFILYAIISRKKMRYQRRLL